MSEALIDHEIKVNGVGLVLAELLGRRVLTERQLGKWNADGVRVPKGREAYPDLWLPDKEYPKAIEVELTQKSDLRYKEIFDRYFNQISYKGSVLYLTGWPKGAEFMWKLARKHDVTRLFVASLQEFRDSGGRCGFTGYSIFCYPSNKTFLTLAPKNTGSCAPVEALAVTAPENLPALEPVRRGQEAPPTASLDAPKEPEQWGVGHQRNPYSHLPPSARPEGYRPGDYLKVGSGGK
ncbi:MAG TPA: hypothetical protein VNH15_07215 [Elusimicrobiota bacterium]|nr:hypothetical protein [Elusimicrobiota bacterium]